jgi:hypothetical protein
MYKHRMFQLIILLILACFSHIILGTDTINVRIEIKQHKFQPEIIEVPAGSKVLLIVCNEDSTVEEFESFDLKREKIIPSKTCVNIRLAALKAGQYEFFGEFHPDTAVGQMIVR